jgi:hypothetical protein
LLVTTAMPSRSKVVAIVGGGAWTLLGCSVSPQPLPTEGLEPALDAQRITMTVATAGKVHIVGGPGAVPMSFGLVRLVDLDSQAPPEEVPLSADGSFAVDAPGGPHDTYRIEWRAGTSGFDRSGPVDLRLQDDGTVAVGPKPLCGGAFVPLTLAEILSASRSTPDTGACPPADASPSGAECHAATLAPVDFPSGCVREIVSVTWRENDHGFVATYPALPLVTTRGKDVEIPLSGTCHDFTEDVLLVDVVAAEGPARTATDVYCIP